MRRFSPPAAPGGTPPPRTTGSRGRAALPPRRPSQGGTVTIEMTISEQGEPTDLQVVESAGEILDAAVLAAVRTWRYTPAENNGVKVQTRLRVTQTFAGGR